MHPTLVKVENSFDTILVHAFLVFKVMRIIIEPLANTMHERLVFGNRPYNEVVESLVLNIDVVVVCVCHSIDMSFDILFVVHRFH